MKAEGKKTLCPDIEALSLYYDGLLCEDTPEFAHISQCPVCLGKVESYRHIDSVLDSALPPASEKELRERIGKAVGREIRRTPRMLSFPMFLAKAASVLFVLFASFYFIRNLYYVPERPYGVNNYSAPDQQSAAPAVEKVAAESTEKPSGKYIAKTEDAPMDPDAPNMNEIPVNDISLASTGGGEKILFSNSDSGKEKPARIPRIVHHVWAVKDIDEARKKIDSIAAEIMPGDKLRARKKNDLSEKLVLKKIDKQNLVGLIRKLSGQGFKLMTPEQPQPENSIFLGRPDEPVKYYFDIVKN